MKLHEQVAEDIRQDIKSCKTTPVKAHDLARQGDVVAKKSSSKTKVAKVTQCPKGGWVISAGVHGEHRLFAEGAYVEKGTAVLPEGGVLVHTDVPTDRHDPIQLDPGTWDFTMLRELSVNETIEQVRD